MQNKSKNDIDAKKRKEPIHFDTFRNIDNFMIENDHHKNDHQKNDITPQNKADETILSFGEDDKCVIASKKKEFIGNKDVKRS